MKERTICKTLAVAVIILFLGLAIQPSLAVQQETDIDIEPKDYLFQTIIDIANNPDVKNLLEHYKFDLFKVDIDRSVYRKLFFRNPRLMVNMLFTKPTMSVEYLNECYNNSVEIIDNIGEDKALEVIETLNTKDKRFSVELNNVISNDKELSDRISTLKEMNKHLKTDKPFPGVLILCAISMILLFLACTICAISLTLSWVFESSFPRLYGIFYFTFFYSAFWVVFIYFALVFDFCPPYD